MKIGTPPRIFPSFRVSFRVSFRIELVLRFGPIVGLGLFIGAVLRIRIQPVLEIGLRLVSELVLGLGLGSELRKGLLDASSHLYKRVCLSVGSSRILENESERTKVRERK